MNGAGRLLPALVTVAWLAGAAGAQSPAPSVPIPYQAGRMWGYADTTGRLAIPAVYDLAGPFRDGLAAVRKDGRWGFIDTRGAVVVPIELIYVQPYSSGLAVAGIDTGRPTGLTVTGPRPGQRTPVTAAKYGFIDRTGAFAIPARYDWARPFQEGVAQVKRDVLVERCPTVGLWGLIDTGGREVIPLQHCHVGPAVDGEVRVVYESRGPNDARVGFVSLAGREVVPKLPYDWAGETWREGRLVVRQAQRWGVVDRAGREVVPPRYEAVGVIAEGRIPVRQGGKWGFLDLAGQVAIPLQYEDVSSFEDGLAQVQVAGRIGLIDLAGTAVVPARLDGRQFRPFREGVRAARLDGKWGFIDRSGAFVVAPSFDDAWSFSEGLAAARQGDLWGFVDRSGRWVIPPRYFQVEEGFGGGLARVKVRRPDPCCPGLWMHAQGYVDRTGREFFDPPRSAGRATP